MRSVVDNITFLFLQLRLKTKKNKEQKNHKPSEAPVKPTVGATNKLSDCDLSDLQQPNVNGEQSATSKGKLTKAGWMMIGPIQTGPVSPAGRTIVIIITHNREELFSPLYLNFTGSKNLEQKKNKKSKKIRHGAFMDTCVRRKDASSNFKLCCLE